MLLRKYNSSDFNTYTTPHCFMKTTTRHFLSFEYHVYLKTTNRILEISVIRACLGRIRYCNYYDNRQWMLDYILLLLFSFICFFPLLHSVPFTMNMSMNALTVKFDRASVNKSVEIFCDRVTVVIYNKTKWSGSSGNSEADACEFNRYVPVSDKECQLFAIPDNTIVFECADIPYCLFWIVLRNTALARSRLVYSNYNVAGFDFDLSAYEEDDFITELETELAKYMMMRPKVVVTRIVEAADTSFECTFAILFGKGSNEPGSVGL